MFRSILLSPLGRYAIAFGGVALVCASVLAYLYWPLWDWLAYPLNYKDDGLWNLFVIKTILQTGWYESNSLLGAPFGSTFLDFAKPEILYLGFFRVLGWFTADALLAHNLFYFSGFFLVIATSLAVLRSGFHLPWVFAGTGALLYAFLPFHFLRLGHLFLSSYFVVPLAVWLALQVSSTRLPFFESGHLGCSRWSVWLAAALLASTSIYYAFFGLCLVFAAGACESVLWRSWKFLVSGMLVCTLVGSLVLVNLSPSLHYWMKEGRNTEVATRSMAEIDVYALRPIQLLLPSEGHRLPAFAALTQKYESGAPFVNENRSAALGLLGSLGFLLLVFTLVAGHRITETRSQFGIAARINMVALILAVAGGGGALLGLLIDPQFRALNRISTVIAFVSIATLLMVIDLAMAKVSVRWRRSLVSVVAGLLVVGGFWDQIPLSVRPDVTAISAEYDSDRKFVQDIEANLPHGARILQLPYIGFPETAPLHREPSYSHLRGFLHAESLRWSYGGMKGRAGDLWQRSLAEKPLAEQVDIARQSGFSGIWLDRRAIHDEGKELEAGLHALGLSLSHESADRFLAFYAVQPTGNTPPNLQLPPILGKGFYAWEGNGDTKWAWTRGDASFGITSPNPASQRVKVTIGLKSLVARTVRVVIDGQMKANVVLKADKKENVDFEYDLPHGLTSVLLATDLPAVLPGNGDRRQLAMALVSFHMAPAGAASQ